MHHLPLKALPLLFAGAVLGQAGNDIGFSRGWAVSAAERIGANNSAVDALLHFDSRNYLDWMLDPADPTGATFRPTGIRFAIQDQVGNTPDTCAVVAYNEDPLNPNFPETGTPWFRTGSINLPLSTMPGPVAWLFTITIPTTTPSTPKGDKWIGVHLTAPTPTPWPVDGTSLLCQYDQGAFAGDLPGLAITSVPNNQFVCTVPVVGGIPVGPAVYPPGTPGSRRQFQLDVIAQTAGGVCITQTNQAGFQPSNPGSPGTPFGGTTNFLSGLHPDVFNGTASTPPRADNPGFLVTDRALPAVPVLVMVAFGPNASGSIPLRNYPVLNSAGTQGTVCIDTLAAVPVLGISDSTGVFQLRLSLSAAARQAIQGLSLPGQPLDIWYQGFVMDPASSSGTIVVHATGCGVQHL